METLIRDLLAYSRVRTEGKEPDPQSMSVRRLWGMRWRTCRPQSKRAAAAVSAEKLLWSLLADPTQLAQLFQNLVGNALKFRADRPPEIQVFAVRRSGEWEIAVKDNGIGIEPNSLERIFKLGIESRLHSRSEYPGSGRFGDVREDRPETWRPGLGRFEGPGKGTTITTHSAGPLVGLGDGMETIRQGRRQATRPLDQVGLSGDPDAQPRLMRVGAGPGSSA